jgi:FkbM family methyltransferase
MRWKRGIQYFFQQLLGTDGYLLFTAIFQWCFLRYLKLDRELDGFLQRIQGKGIIIDAGANLGITSLIMAMKKPDCTIISFEPVLANHRCLSKMVRLFSKGNILIYRAALSDHSGNLKMIQPVQQGVKMHGLSHVADDSENKDACFSVPSLRLMDVTELKLPVSCVGIKIDVENFEWQVIQGGRDVISASRPVIYCEIWNNEKKERTLELLRQLHYSPYVFSHGKWIPYLDQEALNFCFLPEH